MIVGITYSDDKMTKSAELCWASMKHMGISNSFLLGPGDVDPFFKVMNKDIISKERGAGYWLWKPYVINKYIDKCADGDFLIYSDAGVKWIADPRHITDVMDQDLFLFSNGHQHVHWCKMDVAKAIDPFHFFGSEPATAYLNHQQAQASVIFIRVSDFTRKFIKEWLLWCQMPGFIDDSPSVLPNHPEFAEHRHDQAILTCLAIKHGIKLHWWPDHLWYESQRYRWPEDKYPSMVEHHRKRNNEW